MIIFFVFYFFFSYFLLPPALFSPRVKKLLTLNVVYELAECGAVARNILQI